MERSLWKGPDRTTAIAHACDLVAYLFVTPAVDRLYHPKEVGRFSPSHRLTSTFISFGLPLHTMTVEQPAVPVSSNARISDTPHHPPQAPQISIYDRFTYARKLLITAITGLGILTIGRAVAF